MLERNALSSFLLLSVLIICCGCSGTPQPSRETAKQESKFVRAVLIERSDNYGRWLKQPREIRVEGNRVSQIAALFPEIDVEPKQLSVTHEPMRFHLTLSQANGKSTEIGINPHLYWWWDANAVYDLSPTAANEILRLSSEAKPIQSQQIASDAVNLEIIDREDGYRTRRDAPVKAIVTGKEATGLFKSLFPEFGLKRFPQVYDGGDYRFEVNVTFADGKQSKIMITEKIGEPWFWHEGSNYWQLQPSAATAILSSVGNKVHNPSGVATEDSFSEYMKRSRQQTSSTTKRSTP